MPHFIEFYHRIINPKILFFEFLMFASIVLLQAQLKIENKTEKKDVWQKICNEPYNFIKFLQDVRLNENINEISKSFPSLLKESGIQVQLRQDVKKIRIGSKYFDIRDVIFWNHFESQNNSFWIDILEFINKDTCNANYGKYRSDQTYSGCDFIGGWSFWTPKADSGLNAFNVLLKRDVYVFNFGISLPFALKKNEGPYDDKSKLLILNNSIDTLLKIMGAVAKHLAIPAMVELVPKAHPDENNTRLARLAGFARLWSEVKYNFVFSDRLKEIDWEHILDLYLPKIDSAKSREEYVSILQECFAFLKDGHTGVYGENRKDIPAIEIQPIDGKPMVTAIGTTAELKASKIKIGMELIKVNKKPVEEILKNEVYPFIFASTTQDRNIRAFEKLLESEPGSRVLATFKNINGKEIEVALTCNLKSKFDSATWVTSSKPFEYKELDDKIIYVAINSFNSNIVVSEFDKIFDKILNSKGLIIDVRKNGGGNSTFGFDIIARMIDKKCDQTSKWRTRVYKPAFKAWGEKEEWYEGDHEVIEPRGEKPFFGPVVVLIGPKTYSAGEDFLIPLKASGRAKLVGMPTAGSTGQPLFVNAFEAFARICTKWDRFPDGTEFVGVGVKPDIKVELTRNDIIEGKDIVLEKGIITLKQMIK